MITSLGDMFRITGKIHALNACTSTVTVCVMAADGVLASTLGRNRPRIAPPTRRDKNVRRCIFIRTWCRREELHLQGSLPLLLGYPGVYAKSNEKVRDLMSLSCLLYSSCVPTQWKTNKSGLTR